MVAATMKFLLVKLWNYDYDGIVNLCRFRVHGFVAHGGPSESCVSSNTSMAKGF
jgi:hypothetical protein